MKLTWKKMHNYSEYGEVFNEYRNRTCTSATLWFPFINILWLLIQTGNKRRLLLAQVLIHRSIISYWSILLPLGL